MEYFALGFLIGVIVTLAVLWIWREAAVADRWGQELEAMGRAAGPEKQGPYAQDRERVTVARVKGTVQGEPHEFDVSWIGEARKP